jgi:hypothetical protein
MVIRFLGLVLHFIVFHKTNLEQYYIVSLTSTYGTSTIYLKSILFTPLMAASKLDTKC